MSKTPPAEPSPPRFLNRPIPQKLDLPYEHPKQPTNPVVGGLLLYYGALLVTYIPALKHYLWSNTGFTKIRNLLYIDRVEPRYDPTVIPLAPSTTSSSPPPTSASPLVSTTAHRVPPHENNPGRFHTIHDYHAAYTSGSVTPTHLITTLLATIQQQDSPHSTAWIQLQTRLILAAAAHSTARYLAGKPLSILDGIPIAIKDQLDIAGYRKTLGSAHDFADSPDGATETSWCIKQLSSAGAIILGKTNMHELGLDTTNDNPVHGAPPNPYNPSYYPGGSSGGSGYAVGSGLVPIALGADGGGSIRVPAAYCGVFGLKTSHGRVSARPTVGIASTTSVVGPLAANMVDLEVAYRVMAAPDPLHASSCMFPSPTAQLPSTGKKRAKILGICQQWFDRASPAVHTSCTSALSYLVSTHSYTLVPIQLPLLSSGQSAHALTILSEISAAHPDPRRFTPANQILLSVGSCATAADFLAAQKLRQAVMGHLAALWEEWPGMVVVTPTTPEVGWRVHGKWCGWGENER